MKSAPQCPSCGHSIRARHNVPILSWLVLAGRCADCKTPISPRYPLVELGTGIAFVAITYKMHQLGLVSAIPAYLYFTAAGIALALIDLDCRRLPNAIVLPSYPILASLLTAAAAADHRWYALERASIGAACLFALYFAFALISPEGMGFGDVKLAGLIGGVLAYLSWHALLIGAFAGFALGAVAGLILIASRRGTRKTTIPFGPFMIAGAIVTILAA